MYKSLPLRDQNRCACPAPLPKLLPRSGCECGRMQGGGGGVVVWLATAACCGGWAGVKAGAGGRGRRRSALHFPEMQPGVGVGGGGEGDVWHW